MKIWDLQVTFKTDDDDSKTYSGLLTEDYR